MADLTAFCHESHARWALNEAHFASTPKEMHFPFAEERIFGEGKDGREWFASVTNFWHVCVRRGRKNRTTLFRRPIFVSPAISTAEFHGAE